jgi:hypothetical protein
MRVAEPIVAEAPSVVSYPLETRLPAPPVLRGSTPKPLPDPTPDPPALQPPPAPADSLHNKQHTPVSKLTGEPRRPEDPEPSSGKPVSALQQNPEPSVPLGGEVPDPRGSKPKLPVSEPLSEPKKPVALEEASEPLPLQAEEPSLPKALEQDFMLAPLPENVPANYYVSPIAPPLP